MIGMGYGIIMGGLHITIAKKLPVVLQLRGDNSLISTNVSDSDADK